MFDLCKKLLVLDIDYTIFDHVSHAERGKNDYEVIQNKI